MEVKKNQTSFSRGNRSGDHNAELKRRRHVIGQHCTTRTPLRQSKNGGELMCSGRVSSSCSTSVTLVTFPGNLVSIRIFLGIRGADFALFNYCSFCSFDRKFLLICVLGVSIAVLQLQKF
jgi:hypothetical protein